MRELVAPVYLLKLETSAPPVPLLLPMLAVLTVCPTAENTLMLQADPTNLRHLTRELENALAESRSGYFSRIMRNIK